MASGRIGIVDTVEWIDAGALVLACDGRGYVAAASDVDLRCGTGVFHFT